MLDLWGMDFTFETDTYCNTLYHEQELNIIQPKVRRIWASTPLASPDTRACSWVCLGSASGILTAFIFSLLCDNGIFWLSMLIASIPLTSKSLVCKFSYLALADS